MSNNTPPFLFLFVFIFAVCLSGSGVYAFGAGNIPSFAYLEGRAFRHGDIEDTLADLAKKSATGFAIGNLLGARKFGGLDIKRVYFGNWLRDYSQAVDIAGLKKLPLQTILNLCMALGFLAHGYATNEFEVTPERLGCYLPAEHIDNPKGYGEGEDARKYHPGLRGPVNPRELEVDPGTGMKNYIANEQGGWDTSKALVRRTLEKCIHHGRQYGSSNNKVDQYEAFRLLGTALHTLEDFSAHSNFCEIALISMGHQQVFTHVGDNVRIQAPNGRWVSPIVTGTFGGNDFIHSLLGEAGDKLSEASVSDLNKKMNADMARSGGGSRGPADTLRSLFSALPNGAGGEMSRDMENIERIRAGPSQGGKKPEDMSPQELHAVLWQVLSFRDSVVKKIEKTIEKIPGLGSLIEKLMDSISVFVFTTLEPFLKPVLQSATSGLSAASNEVIDSHDQYEVFNDPRASDPTHSFLSKDHFNLILNEPAGQLAKVILAHAVPLITKAWSDTSANVHQITEDIVKCLFHPDFMDRNSKVQKEMMDCMHQWFKEAGSKDVLSRLTKEAVRGGNNKRGQNEGGKTAAQTGYAHGQGVQAQQAVLGYAQNIPGVSQVSQFLGGGSGNKREGDFASSGGGGGYPGSHSGEHSHSHGHAYSGSVPSTGQAASYYGGGAGGGASSIYAPPGGSSYGAPSGPPPGSSSYAPPSGPTSGYGAPSGPPPSHHHSGYNPSYSSSSPSFPGAAAPPSFPGANYGGSSLPGRSPGFPDAYGPGPGYGAPPGGPPPGGAPGFPGSDPYGGGHHHHHGQGPPGFPQAHPPYGGGGW